MAIWLWAPYAGVVVVVDKPVWPKGAVVVVVVQRDCRRLLKAVRHNHQSQPIVYVTNADGTLHRSGVACVWACVWECGPHTRW